MKKLVAGLAVFAFILAAQFGGGSTTLPPGTLVPIANVINLTTELANRAIKSSTFTVSRAAFINASGHIESVAGATSNCVLVNGTSAACAGGGGSAGTAVAAEQPSGSGLVYTLTQPPIAGSQLVVVNGLALYPTTDYTLSTATLTFTASYSWLTAGQIRVYYRY